jgi:hypothetical protein
MRLLLIGLLAVPGRAQTRLIDIVPAGEAPATIAPAAETAGPAPMETSAPAPLSAEKLEPLAPLEANRTEAPKTARPTPAPREETKAPAWRRLAEAISLDPEQAEVWRQRTFDMMRNDPGLPIEEALLSTLPGAGERRTGTIENVIYSKPLPLMVMAEQVHQIKVIDGALHVAAETGLSRLDNDGKWTHLFLNAVRAVGKVGEKLYIGVDNGRGSIWSKDANRVSAWTKERRLSRYVLVEDFAQVDGRPLALFRKLAKTIRGSANKLLFQGRLGWSRPMFWGLGTVHQLFEGGGATYAVASNGLFRKGESGWERIWPDSFIDSAAYADGRLYLTAHSIVFELVDGQLKHLAPLPAPEGPVERLVALNDRLYAIRSGHLYGWTGDRWESIVQLPNLKGAAALGNRIVLYDHDSVWIWSERAANYMSALKRRALEDLGVSLQAAQNEAPAEPAKELRETEGRIEKAGRTIFSTLSGVASRIGFGFGEPPSSEPAPRNDEDWSALDGLLSDRMGIEASEETSGRFRRDVILTLRSNPGLALETAIERGFSKAHSLVPAQAERVQQILNNYDDFRKLDASWDEYKAEVEKVKDLTHPHPNRVYVIKTDRPVTLMAARGAIWEKSPHGYWKPVERRLEWVDLGLHNQLMMLPDRWAIKHIDRKGLHFFAVGEDIDMGDGIVAKALPGGLWSFDLPLPEGWRSRLLRDAAAYKEAAPPADQPSGPISSDEDGVIGRGGRSIFSTLGGPGVP